MLAFGHCSITTSQLKAYSKALALLLGVSSFFSSLLLGVLLSANKLDPGPMPARLLLLLELRLPNELGPSVRAGPPG